MKARTFMAVMAIVLVLSCQKTSRSSTDERTLNLTAPSGQQIAKSFDKLKNTTASVLEAKLGIRQNFTITSIDYLPVPKGCAAVINFKLDNGQTGSVGVLSINNLKALTPAVDAGSGAMYDDADSNTVLAYLTCTGTCECRAYLAYNKRTGEVTKSCGCEECTGEVTYH
ncbi:MAG TPA: hypothetical protein VEB42_03175 [Chitinophagaceae bacterium]|nr:hypothetical protein [Chitinophagaceae bacterium]